MRRWSLQFGGVHRVDAGACAKHAALQVRVQAAPDVAGLDHICSGTESEPGSCTYNGAQLTVVLGGDAVPAALQVLDRELAKGIERPGFTAFPGRAPLLLHMVDVSERKTNRPVAEQVKQPRKRQIQSRTGMIVIGTDHGLSLGTVV